MQILYNVVVLCNLAISMVTSWRLEHLISLNTTFDNNMSQRICCISVVCSVKTVKEICLGRVVFPHSTDPLLYLCKS